jgi:CRP-like cAMP-binding protein
MAMVKATAAGATRMLRINELLSNRILTALPGEDFERLVRHLEPVSLAAGQTLFAQGEPAHHLYFPENCVVSFQCGMQDGKSVEVGMIGREGVVGLSALFGPAHSRQEVSVTASGSALRARADDVRREFERGVALRQLFERFSGEYAAHVSQRSACSVLHSIKRRFAVWLLLLTERLGADTVEMTQERIAAHLGVRRAGITVIAGELQDKGVLASSRGSVRLLDRRALESVACECYWALSGDARQTSLP